MYAALATGTYLCGIGLGVYSFRLHGGLFPVTVATCWVMTVNGARRMISTVAHQCVHGVFSGNKRLDLACAEVLSALTLTQTAADYRNDHFGLHHRHEVFSSIADPSARLLWDAGFRPGRSVRHLCWILLATAISPWFHGKFVCRRIISQSRGQLQWYRLGSLLLVCAGLWLLASATTLHAVLFGAVLPVTVLYQASVLLEFVSEHAWFVAGSPVGRRKYVHGTHSWGRFCGRRTPSANGKGLICATLEWLVWAAEHLVYHLPVRLVVLPGDLSQHDFHHRNPSDSGWKTAAYARRDDVDAGDRRWPPYREFWGLHNAIGHVFRGIATATVIPD
ncbi:hypothetical protein ATN79_47655 [Paraburkholderia caribensis]|nr:hypothetical protein ATN79_47655 [Paraburkholderia caribensis]